MANGIFPPLLDLRLARASNRYRKYQFIRPRTIIRLTSFTDYGLRILMLMARTPEQAMTTSAMAQELGLSRHHLAKIIQQLARGGIVETRRGGGGGTILAKPPGAIRVGAVVRLLEDDQPLVDCLAANGGQCSLDPHCRLKARLRAAEHAFLADLDRSTLADVTLPNTRAA